MTRVKVTVNGEGVVARCELSGSFTHTLADKESREFHIGAEGAVVTMLTVHRVSKGSIKITRETGRSVVSVDRGSDKTIGMRGITLRDTQKTALVREAS